MIQLGCNYSPELMELISKNVVEIDWIKLANEKLYYEQYKVINSIKPILFHMVPRVMSDKNIEGWNIEKTNIAIKECKSPHVASHFRANANDIKGPVTRDVLKEKAIELLLNKKERTYSELLIENMPINRLPSGYEYLAEPEMIKEICEEAGVGLLLDLAHLKISAWYRKESEIDYLKRLPLNLVKEIHVSGPRKKGEEYYDVHQNMSEEDFDFLKIGLSLTKPRIITLEYGGEGEDYNGRSDIKLLHNQLIRLEKLVRSDEYGIK